MGEKVGYTCEDLGVTNGNKIILNRVRPELINLFINHKSALLTVAVGIRYVPEAGCFL